MSHDTAQLILAVVIIGTALGWFAPVIIAARRGAGAQHGILALLLCAPFFAFAGPVGWLLVAIAWLVAIVWSLTGGPARARDRAAA